MALWKSRRSCRQAANQATRWVRHGSVASLVSRGRNHSCLRQQIPLDPGKDDLRRQCADEKAHQPADDLQALVAEQAFDVALPEPGDGVRIEVPARAPVAGSFAQDRDPAESCLSALETQNLKERSIIVNRNAPLLVRRTIIARPEPRVRN